MAWRVPLRYKLITSGERERRTKEFQVRFAGPLMISSDLRCRIALNAVKPTITEGESHEMDDIRDILRNTYWSQRPTPEHMRGR